jgi:hypothetical protein
LEPEFVQDIEEKIERRRSFTISGILLKDLKEFKDFCKAESNDSYSMGIVQLLRYKNQTEQFLSLFNLLQKQIDELKTQLNYRKGRTFE